MSNIRGILLPRRSSVSLSKSNIFSLMTIMLRYITNKPECCFYKQNESGIYDTRLLHEILIEKNRFHCFSNSKPNCNPSYWFNNEVAALIVELELPKAPPMV